MTRNQILKSQLYETAAHNRAMESIAAGELAERARSNRSRETIDAERNRITQQRYETQSRVDLMNAQTMKDRTYYEHMDRLQTYQQRRREWESSMGQFYARLSFDYKRMEADNARRDAEIRLKKAQLRQNGFASMGKMAVDAIGTVAKLALPSPVSQVTSIAKKLFK